VDVLCTWLITVILCDRFYSQFDDCVCSNSCCGNSTIAFGIAKCLFFD
jgi:hypothetical protein